MNTIAVHGTIKYSSRTTLQLPFISLFHIFRLTLAHSGGKGPIFPSHQNCSCSTSNSGSTINFACQKTLLKRQQEHGMGHALEVGMAGSHLFASNKMGKRLQRHQHPQQLRQRRRPTFGDHNSGAKVKTKQPTATRTRLSILSQNIPINKT